MQSIIKRDGSVQVFDSLKIVNAINGAYGDVYGHVPETSKHIPKLIADTISGIPETLTVEQIQDKVEQLLMENKEYKVAKAYIEYRQRRSILRKENTTDKTLLDMLKGDNEYWNTENANKNVKVVHTQRDYIAGITSEDFTRRLLLTPEIVDAHDKGIIHFHDADYFAQNVLNNCCLINIEDMLQNGTAINGIHIDKPHRLLTATTITTQIITAVSSSQYGGCTITLTHLAPFVRESKKMYTDRFCKIVFGDNYKGDDEACPEKWVPMMNTPEYKEKLKLVIKLVDESLQKEIRDAAQTFAYQVNSMSTTNGQAPFLSVCMYINENPEYKNEVALLTEEFLKQRIQGLKNSKGVYITPAFPKLLYVLDEDNAKPGSPYYYLTQLAAQCTAKRMVPDYISAKVMRKLKKGNVYPCMGCRSFLTPDRTNGNPAHANNYTFPKYYGRFNQGVVTINLPYVALLTVEEYSKGNLPKENTKEFYELFFKQLEQYLELCHRALRIRHDRLCNGISDMAPIMWQDGALARLKSGESIKPLLYDGYSTISLGYAGLYECVKAMTGESVTGEHGHEFGLHVMQFMNDMAGKWKAAENIDYSVYGTPIESTTYKFAKALKKQFGDDVFVKLDNVDRNYITNSYHIPVFEHINPFEKLAREAEFQALSPGGAISYIECADLTKNIDAVLQVIDFIYENIMYAELNTKSDYCQVCGYDGEIQIVDMDNKLDWKCPNCGNTDHAKMNVARRTCGYIGTNFFNQGRTNEIKDRYVHLDDHLCQSCK